MSALVGFLFGSAPTRERERERTTTSIVQLGARPFSFFTRAARQNITFLALFVSLSLDRVLVNRQSRSGDERAQRGKAARAGREFLLPFVER